MMDIELMKDTVENTTTFDGYAFYDLEGDKRDEEDPEYPVITYKKMVINNVKFLRVLKHLGFRRIDIKGIAFLVNIKDNVVDEVEQKDIIDAFITHMEAMPADHPHYRVRENIQSTIIGRLGFLFSDYMLDRLIDKKKREFLTDTKEYCYFFYKNGCVQVSKDLVKFIKYENIDQYIFKNKILNRDFKILPKEKYESSNWAQFINNIGDNYMIDGFPKNQKRYLKFKKIIGYCLHGYFEGKLKAIIFTDARISDEADGRTGKTLLCKGMGKMLNVTDSANTYKEINGKDFDPTDRFKWQQLGIDTKLVHLNDVKKYFAFDALFNDISEGIQRQRKNESPFHVWAKIILSTNRTIRIHGSSSEDRSLEFEMADYYSAKFSPQDEFKQWFFRDWDAHQWNQFDNVMISCVQDYLQDGLTTPGTINLKKRKMIEETQQEFIDFMEWWNIENLIEYNQREGYESFLKKYPDFSKLRQSKFNKYLRTYAEFNEDIKEMKSRQSNGQYLFSYEYVSDAQKTNNSEKTK